MTARDEDWSGGRGNLRVYRQPDGADLVVVTAEVRSGVSERSAKAGMEGMVGGILIQGKGDVGRTGWVWNGGEAPGAEWMVEDAPEEGPWVVYMFERTARDGNEHLVEAQRAFRVADAVQEAARQAEIEGWTMGQRVETGSSSEAPNEMVLQIGRHCWKECLGPEEKDGEWTQERLLQAGKYLEEMGRQAGIEMLGGEEKMFLVENDDPEETRTVCVLKTELTTEEVHRWCGLMVVAKGRPS